MRVLLIRFSSFGDIVQTMAAASALRHSFPRAKIDWLTRQEFVPLCEGQPFIDQVYGLDRGAGWRGLFTLGRELRNNGYSHVYDAHNNLRSRMVCWILTIGAAHLHFVRRGKQRWKQLLLLYFRRDLFERPQIAQKSYVTPLKVWQVQDDSKPTYFKAPPFEPSRWNEILLPDTAAGDYIGLVPCTAHPLKAWPESHWLSLIAALPEQKFVLLGGPGEAICERLSQSAPQRVINLAGRLSLSESCAVIDGLAGVVAADTGLLHVADAMGKPAVGLYGPVMCCYPRSPNTQVLEVPVDCRCRHPQEKKCLVDITPERVVRALQRRLHKQRDEHEIEQPPKV